MRQGRNQEGQKTGEHNVAMNLTAAGRSALRPLLLRAVSMLVEPIEIPVRRPQVMAGALSLNDETNIQYQSLVEWSGYPVCLEPVRQTPEVTEGMAHWKI
jgi:hypothetical protein